jgi:hypothetical protein
MKSIITILLSLSMFSDTAFSADPIRVKVAVLDNLQSQKYASEQYEKDYFAGMDAAANEAKLKGILIEIKHFPYGKDSLDILKEIPKIKEWQADVVIGPRSSNKFLMLKDQFQDILVLSPLSTATAVSELPENFYSLTLPNEYAVKGLVQATTKLFPKKPIHKIIEADCKNCVDFGALFESIFHEGKKRFSHFTGASFLSEQAEKLDISVLMKDHPKDALILLPNTSYTTGVLVARISEYLKRDGVTFIGNDDWGTWKAGYIGKVKSTYKYKGIRIIPWSLDMKSPILSRCSNSYNKKFGHALPDTISMLTCHAINVVSELVSESKDVTKSVRARILSSFRAKKAKDQNVFRSTYYAIHEITQTGERFLFSQPISMEKKP